jgi:hypothetical protein
MVHGRKLSCKRRWLLNSPQGKNGAATGKPCRQDEVMAGRYFTAATVLVTVLVQGARSEEPDKKLIAQAVERGIAHLTRLQSADGSWPTHQIGATGLVGITLLECDVPATDPAVQKTAEFLRRSWTDISDLHTTYCLALSILFFDRLGDPQDTPIIQALALRLLAGQNAAGGWSYVCPQFGQEDFHRLKALLHQQVELKARTAPPKMGARSLDDRPVLPKEMRLVLARLESQKAATLTIEQDPSRSVGGDNSNTQFAVLALWAARRYGVPVEKALARTAARFRGCQHSDGGWGYTTNLVNGTKPDESTAAMTCAGLLGLAFGYGGAYEATLRTGRPKFSKGASASRAFDLTKDGAVRNGLITVARVIGSRLEDPRLDSAPGRLSDMYYLLWSVERVGVAYSMHVIGGRDWYAWGSAALLAGQRADGGWMGKLGSDVDTSFALLFLRRANLASDLTAYLKGAGSMDVTLKTDSAMVDKAARSDTGSQIEGEQTSIPAAQPVPPERGPSNQAPADNHVEAEAARLGQELLKSAGSRQDQVVEQLKQAKGVAYTEALAAAIPRLSGTAKTKAREALAERLARMTAATLRDKLQDEAPEVRRAAALACASKADQHLVPNLIVLLEDREATVVRAAHTALKHLTNQDFGPAADASATGRSQAAAAWKEWWKSRP